MSGGKRHTARQGESVESIAYTAGHFWQTVWDHPENATLRELRRSPHVLQPGDVVFVPELQQKQFECATGRQHPFRRKGVPSRLRIRFLVDDKPRAGQSYTLLVDKEPEKTGTTDGDGWLDEPVSPLAARAEVRFPADPPPPPPEKGSFDEEGPDIVRDDEPPADEPEAPSEIVYTFDLRFLDPASEVSGAQGRLRHLGYALGPPTGAADPRTEEALRAFQAEQGLEVTGELDAATQDKLRQFAPG